MNTTWDIGNTGHGEGQAYNKWRGKPVNSTIHN
jgi:hypothetical protein